MHKTCTSFIITSITHVFYNGEKKVIFLNRMDENGCQMYARWKQLFFILLFFLFSALHMQLLEVAQGL